MAARREMLKGQRPSECAYCWKIEDLSPKVVSDRFKKSGESWALPELEKIRASAWNERVTPSYLEVSFSNVCNFKCAYCAPQFSSKWLEEVRERGQYPVSSRYMSLENLASRGRLPIPENEPNPYVDAFWKWWPELYPKLKVLRVTGGEPLLTRHTFRLMEKIRRQPHPDLDFAINSNLGAPDQVIENFLNAVDALMAENAVGRFTLFTSIDAWGEQAEYIRYGMNFERFWSNVRRALSRLPQIQLSFICTYNILSTQGIEKLVIEVGKLKSEFGDRVMIDFPYLVKPEYLCAQLLPPEFATPAERCLTLPGLSDFERCGLRRLVEWMHAPRALRNFQRTEDQIRFRADFAIFIKEYDLRRGVDFRKVFPELAGFLDFCRLDADSP